AVRRQPVAGGKRERGEEGWMEAGFHFWDETNEILKIDFLAGGYKNSICAEKNEGNEKYLGSRKFTTTCS
ncbi:MAG: hypothetical protein LBM92_06065, partial [Opitutaceae bacterium]|nr:hypothetical protein [Opitutaceae bacterium]